MEKEKTSTLQKVEKRAKTNTTLLPPKQKT